MNMFTDLFNIRTWKKDFCKNLLRTGAACVSFGGSEVALGVGDKFMKGNRDQQADAARLGSEPPPPAGPQVHKGDADWQQIQDGSRAHADEWSRNNPIKI